MSVLKSKRGPNKAEYVRLASEIFDETLNFLSRMSARYARLLAPGTMEMATRLQNCADMAQDHYTSDEVRLDLRERDILEARGALAALDHMLLKCYRVMMLNPQGCFATGKKKTEGLTAADAQDRLDRWAQRLGEKIAEEEKKLDGLLKSDAEARRKLRAGKWET